MIKKSYSKHDVVTVAMRRIKNIFETSPQISFSVSGGKDSICLNELLYRMCTTGEIDKSKLTVQFIDEEAIYPCIEKQVNLIRNQWLQIGVKFNWWCIEVKHFNCLNSLTNDESFICWDSNKKDVWIRKKPSFAITNHPLLRKRIDTYQEFLDKLNKNKITLIGVRVSESIQRMNSIASKKSDMKQFPIYDWTDNDVWLFIKERNLEFPKAYIYMYQVGIKRNKLRISQFFSIDTMGCLVNMCEFYPDLFEKICRREPNAYMAMLYYDTELFRRSNKINSQNIDYKSKFFKLIKEKDKFTTKIQKSTLKKMINFANYFGKILVEKHYKEMYQILLAGDPKGRTFRALYTSVSKNYYNGVVKCKKKTF